MVFAHRESLESVCTLTWDQASKALTRLRIFLYILDSISLWNYTEGILNPIFITLQKRTSLGNLKL